MSPVKIRLTYVNANISQNQEVEVVLENSVLASDAVHDLLQTGVQPKVEFVFSDGVVREVPASFMV